MVSMTAPGPRSKKQNRGRGKSVINQALVELMSRTTLAGVAEHDVCKADTCRQSFVFQNTFLPLPICSIFMG
jgi:hypothetical protein